jgi:hypothetical protein
VQSYLELFYSECDVAIRDGIEVDLSHGRAIGEVKLQKVPINMAPEAKNCAFRHLFVLDRQNLQGIIAMFKNLILVQKR